MLCCGLLAQQILAGVGHFVFERARRVAAALDVLCRLGQALPLETGLQSRSIAVIEHLVALEDALTVTLRLLVDVSGHQVVGYLCHDVVALVLHRRSLRGFLVPVHDVAQVHLVALVLLESGSLSFASPC